MKDVLKVIVTGEKGVGVNTLLEKDFGEIFGQKNIETIGVNFRIKQTDFTEDLIGIQFWQLERTKRFESIQKSYYINTDIGLLIVDLTRRETFLSVKKIIREIWEEEGLIPIIILGNKIDLKEIDSNFMDESEIEEYCKEITQKVGEEGFEVKFFPVSAITRQNMVEVLDYLDNLCLEVFRRNFHGNYEKIKVKFRVNEHEGDQVKEEKKQRKN